MSDNSIKDKAVLKMAEWMFQSGICLVGDCEECEHYTENDKACIDATVEYLWNRSFRRNAYDWKGKPIDSYSKDELCKIILELNRDIIYMSKQHMHEMKMVGENE